jgi:glycerol-3-phosphate dehydrogenase
LEAGEAERAVRLYGTEAFELHAQGVNLVAEVGHAVENEGALTLEDYWVRRSARARFELDGGVGVLDRASKRMGELMGWAEKERAQQVDHCRNMRDKEMKVHSGTS